MYVDHTVQYFIQWKDDMLNCFCFLGVIVVCVIVCHVRIRRKKRIGQETVEAGGVHVEGNVPFQPTNVAAANNPPYAGDNQVDVQEPVHDPVLPPDVPVQNCVNERREDLGEVRDRSPDRGPHPHAAEPNEPVPVNNQLFNQAVALGMGALDTGSVPSNIHEVHRQRQLPGTRVRSRSASSNADAVSVCKVPTEETRLQRNPSYFNPVQEVGKQGEGVVLRGMQDTGPVQAENYNEVRGY